MEYSILILLLYELLALIHRGSQSEQPLVPIINLTARYTNKNIILVCDVRGAHAKDWNIYLTCPFTVERLCYTNCKSNCQSPNDCLPMISSCSIEPKSDDHVRLKWSIDMSLINKSGDWKCSQRNTYSNPISLKQSTRTNIIDGRIRSNEKKVNELATQPDIMTLFPQREVEVGKGPEKNSRYGHLGFDIWQFISQPNIVLILFCVFTVSLLLNIVFLIRCALFRSVIDNYLHSRKYPDSCLFKCFCIPVNRESLQGGAHIVPQHKSSTSTDYQRDAIYDDMSSGSNADRHILNNNCSPCEHDILLQRKLWNPDGSFRVMNRQSHICPGKAAGNYVLIKGPMCSNRNYIPIHTPSSASIASNSQYTHTTDLMERSLTNEFLRPEYCMNNDNAIYSQPIKNRMRCFDPISNDDLSNKYANNFIRMYPAPPLTPPLLPVTVSTDEIRRMSLDSESIPMKTVDLIEHCNQSTDEKFN